MSSIAKKKVARICLEFGKCVCFIQNGITWKDYLYISLEKQIEDEIKQEKGEKQMENLIGRMTGADPLPQHMPPAPSSMIVNPWIRWIGCNYVDEIECKKVVF